MQQTGDCDVKQKSLTDSHESTFPQKDDGIATLFRPSKPVILPTSDINIEFERRNNAKYGFTMITSVAHVWFNAFFESQSLFTRRIGTNSFQSQETMDLQPPQSGVFSIPWESLDGVRGFTVKGTRALDRLSVIWRVVAPDPCSGQADLVTEQRPAELGPKTQQNGES